MFGSKTITLSSFLGRKKKQATDAAGTYTVLVFKLADGGLTEEESERLDTAMLALQISADDLAGDVSAAQEVKQIDGYATDDAIERAKADAIAKRDAASAAHTGLEAKIRELRAAAHECSAVYQRADAFTQGLFKAQSRASELRRTHPRLWSVSA